MGRNSNVAAAAIGGAIGYKIGAAAKNSIAARKFKKAMFKSIVEDFGVTITIEVFNSWFANGCSLDFDYRNAADELVASRLYKTLHIKYGEEAADFIELRMLKSKRKGVPINLDNELYGYLANDGSPEDEKYISHFLKALYDSQSQYRREVEKTLMTIDKPPALIRSLLFVFCLFFTLNLAFAFWGVSPTASFVIVLVGIVLTKISLSYINKSHRERKAAFLNEVLTKS